MKIVITGMGTVSVAGVGRAAFAESLRQSPPLQPAESVGPLDLAGHLKAAKTYLDRNSQLGLVAASMALEEAGLSPIEGLNVGVSFGTAVGNLQTTETFLTTIRQKGPKLASPLLFIHSYPNTTSSLMAIEWSLTGPALNFCSGGSAGFDAIIAGAEAVSDGKADVMLTGSAEADGQLLRASYPGIAFREAAGMLTLETESTATAREAVIHAELAGWARMGDADACLRKALGQAELTMDAIDLVVLDGAEPPQGTSKEKCVWLNKYAGETLSAGSALATIAAASRIESDAKVRCAVVLTGGLDHGALVLRKHEQS